VFDSQQGQGFCFATSTAGKWMGDNIKMDLRRKGDEPG
jgi:hypothetical protein